MKATIEGSSVRRGGQAYTLVELLCSVGIILLLVAMLLPAMRNGYAKAQRIYCVNNLHQMGLAFHGFAQSHQDRFPMQVSTNDGGSLEFLRAANTMTGEFYFSYRHFVPLSNELAAPKILGCPSDTRHPATNFAALQNENLSYFAAGNPEPGHPNSVLAGNRNVSPAFGSVARLGSYRSLRWTEELHRFKGNVLFSDGHVDELNDVLSITNSGSTAETRLQMPSTKPAAGVPVPPCGPGGYGYSGGSSPHVRSAPTTVLVSTNQDGTNQVITFSPGSSGRPKGATYYFPDGAGSGADGVSLPPDSRSGSPLARAATAHPKVGDPEVDPWSLKGMYQQVINKGQRLIRRAAVVVYDVPWYLLLLLLLALLELRRRMRARQRTSRLA